METEKKELIKYDNHFNLTDLSNLGSIEQNIFFTICSQFTEKKTGNIIIEIDELKRKADMINRGFTQEQFEKTLLSATDKVIKLIFTVQDEEEIVQMPLFKAFRTRIKQGKIIVEINEVFQHYFYSIPAGIGFSQFELEQIVNIRSKYGKTLFRYLVHNFTGKWSLKFKDFRQLLGFPNSYPATQIKETLDRIIPDIEKQGYITEIKVEYTIANTQGRPIKDIIFNYKINPYKALEEAGQTTLGDYSYEVQTEPKTQLEVDTSDPLHPVAVEKTVEVERKCPKCTKGNVLRRQAQKEGLNFGKWYEKCEFNTPNTINRCHYYRWLDEEETKRAESERLTIIE